MNRDASLRRAATTTTFASTKLRCRSVARAERSAARSSRSPDFSVGSSVRGGRPIASHRRRTATQRRSSRAEWATRPNTRDCVERFARRTSTETDADASLTARATVRFCAETVPIASCAQHVKCTNLGAFFFFSCLVRSRLHRSGQRKKHVQIAWSFPSDPHCIVYGRMVSYDLFWGPL